MFFWFLCMGSSPKRLKVFFYVIIAWRFILFFSVYGFKWWTDNLKSRQVERVLTNFKGCEPSCRKVQKVAALVGSGGWPYIYIFHVYIIIHIIYIYMYIYYSYHNHILQSISDVSPRCARICKLDLQNTADLRISSSYSKHPRRAVASWRPKSESTRVTNGIPMKQGDK
jgi:hypothetical protein